MAEKERASRQVIVISLITAACLIGDSMLYIVLPICFAQAGLSSLWEVGIILSVNRLVRLDGPAELIGQFRQVRITDANTWSLFGELAE